MENSQKPQRKGVVALTSFIIILALMVLGLVTAYYFKSDRVIDLQQQVTELKASAAEKDKALAQSQGTSGMTTPVVRYREIPELGVKYKLTDQTEGLTYSVLTYENDTIRGTHFSTIAMSGMRNDANEFPCESQNAPSGIIARYSNGDRIIQGKTVKEVGKKVGHYYYVYSHPQYACSLSNGVPVDGLEKSIDAVKAAFDSLEAM